MERLQRSAAAKEDSLFRKKSSRNQKRFAKEMTQYKRCPINRNFKWKPKKRTSF